MLRLAPSGCRLLERAAAVRAQRRLIVSGFAFLFGIAALVVKLAGLYKVPGLASLVVLTDSAAASS